MLDPLAFALTAEGAAICGRALLQLLHQFEGRQLATYGASGVPLMQAVIAQGRGRYHGLLIRKERKGHGARRRLEGPVDPREPVVLIDDTVSSGGSLEAARAALLEEGLFVEGAVVLVRFDWAGCARLAEQGLQVEAVLDLERDLAPEVEGTPSPADNPLLPPESLPWAPASAPEGLSPPALARLLLEHQLVTGTLLRPPATLDRTHDARGGAIVSLRSGAGLWDRHARSGFWRHPGDEGRGAAHEIALACWKAARQLPPGEEGKALLARSALGVTLFGALRSTRLGELDHRQDGVVIVSQARNGIQAGALPNLPGITSAAEQLAHARRMGGLTRTEPIRLFRHRVTKHAEHPAWPVGGAPDSLDGWTRRPLGAALTRRARAWVEAALQGGRPQGPPIKSALPAGVDYVFLTVLADGEVGACVGATPSLAPEPMLERLTARALGDPRSGGLRNAERLAVELSFLYARLDTGPLGFGEAARHLRPGLDAMGVVQGERDAILLPTLAVHEDLGREAFLQVLLQKAGIEAPPAAYQLWRTASWLDDGEGVWPVDGAFPRAPSEAGDASARLRRLLAEYLVRNVEPDGRLPSRYHPFQDRLIDDDDLERQSFVAWVMTQRACTDPRADEAVRRLLARLEGRLDAETGRGPSGTAMRLAARCALGANAEVRAPLVRALVAFPLDGGMETGHILVALAQAQAAGDPLELARVEAGLRRLRHTFRRHPLMRDAVLPWAVLAHAAWAPFGERASRIAFVHEAVDVARSLQSAHGGFQTDTQEDAPGCTTAPMLEALAAALRLAPRPGDREAFDRGVRFLDGLVCQERDAGVLPNPGFAEGGLRYSHRRSTIRIDFVAHALHALLIAEAAEHAP